MKSHIIAATVVCLIGMLSMPTGLLAQEDELVGKILFSSEGDIYVMDADSSGLIQLTDDPAADFDGAWSPDGTKIAFRSHRDGNEEIYLMDADGSNQINLTQNRAGDWSPAWSPDGTKIVFASGRAGAGNDLFNMNVDGTDVIQITDIPGINEYPSWSPDGTRIVFHCTYGRRLAVGEADFEICVVDLATGEVTQLTDTPGVNKHPIWSPDGTQIAFQSSREGWPTLPDYTPPAYEDERFGEYDIYVMEADGTNQINLTQNPREDDSFPAWSPDNHLIFSRYGCLMIMDADGDNLRQFAPERECSMEFPDWFQE